MATQRLVAPKFSNRLSNSLGNLQNQLREDERQEVLDKRYDSEQAYRKGRDSISDNRYVEDRAYKVNRDNIVDDRYDADRAYKVSRDEIGDKRYADSQVFKQNSEDRAAENFSYNQSQRAQNDFTKQLINEQNQITNESEQKAFNEKLKTYGGFDPIALRNAKNSQAEFEVNQAYKKAQTDKLNRPKALKYTAHFMTNSKTGAKVKVGSDAERKAAEKAGYSTLGQLPKGKGGTGSSSSKKTLAKNESAYSKLKKTATTFGITDSAEAIDNIEMLQAFGVKPVVVEDIITKQNNAGIGLDKSLSYTDLNKYGPKVLDVTTGEPKPLGDVLKFAKENEGFEIVVGKDGGLTFGPAKPKTSSDEINEEINKRTKNAGSSKNGSNESNSGAVNIDATNVANQSSVVTNSADSDTNVREENRVTIEDVSTPEEIAELKRLRRNNRLKASEFEDKLQLRVNNMNRRAESVDNFKISQGTHSSQKEFVEQFGLGNEFANANNKEERLQIIEEAKKRRDVQALSASLSR